MIICFTDQYTQDHYDNYESETDSYESNDETDYPIYSEETDPKGEVGLERGIFEPSKIYCRELVQTS